MHIAPLVFAACSRASRATTVCSGPLRSAVNPDAEPGTISSPARSYSTLIHVCTTFCILATTHRSRLLLRSSASSPGFIASIATQSFHALGTSPLRTTSLTSSQQAMRTWRGACLSTYVLKPSAPTAFLATALPTALSKASHVRYFSTASCTARCLPSSACPLPPPPLSISHPGLPPPTHFIAARTAPIQACPGFPSCCSPYLLASSLTFSGSTTSSPSPPPPTRMVRSLVSPPPTPLSVWCLKNLCTATSIPPPPAFITASLMPDTNLFDVAIAQPSSCLSASSCSASM